MVLIVFKVWPTTVGTVGRHLIPKGFLWFISWVFLEKIIYYVYDIMEKLLIENQGIFKILTGTGV